MRGKSVLTPSKAIERVAIAAALLLADGAPAAAQDTGALYQAVAIVTGTGEVNRRLGLAQCLEDVLVKVSGDARLVGDRRVAALARRADTLVAQFRYRDRFAHRPINDEQGTRDRPHDLTVDFDPSKVDAELAKLGRQPWTASRPRLVVYVAVNNGAATYVLASDGERGADQRESLAAAARQVAIPISVPNEAGLAAASATFQALATIDPAQLDAAAKSAGGHLALVGRLVWSDQARGWIVEWRLASEGKLYRWQIRGVSFDDAFRTGMRGAAQILSGNGKPNGSCEAPSRRSRQLGRACPT
jgi:hypothetical protein